MPLDAGERRPLRTIGLSVAVSMAIVLSLAWALVQHGHTTALHGGQADMARVVNAAENDLNRTLVSLDGFLAEVAAWSTRLPTADAPLPAHPGTETITPRDLQRLLQATLSQNLMLRDVAVVAADGTVLASARPETERLGMTAPPGFMERVRRQPYPALLIGTPTTSDLTPESVLHLARSARLGNGSQVVVLAELRLALLSSTLDPRDAQNATVVTLENEAGMLLASHPMRDAAGAAPLMPPLSTLPTDGIAVVASGRLDGQSSWMAIRPLIYPNLWVSASQPTQVMLATWRNERQAIGWIAAALCLLTAMVGLGGMRHVQRMARARTEVAMVNDRLQASNQELGHTLSLVQATLEASGDAIMVVNHQGKVSQFNTRYTEVLGLPPARLAGMDITELRQLIGELLVNAEQATRMALAAYAQPMADTSDELLFKDGRVFLRRSKPQLLDGEVVGRVWSHQDITAFRDAEKQLLQQQADLNQARDKLSATMEALPDLLFELDETGLYMDVRAHNPAKMVVPPHLFLGRRVHEVMSEKSAREVMACLQEAKATGSSYGRQLRLNTVTSGIRWFELSAARKKSDPGEPVRLIVVAHDVTDRKQNEELIWHQAHFDPLTGLPNRRMFREHLERALLRSAQKNHPLALMFIDLDRFKDINDTHGHDMGDLLLQTAAMRLRSCVRDTDLVARLGGDEFTLVVEGPDNDRRIDAISRDVLARLAEPYHLGAEVEYLSGSIGVTVFPTDGQDADTLIKQADQAMYVAKRAGRNRCERFDPVMQEAALLRSRLARDLRSALAGGQFHVLYQPIVDMKTGEIRKAEALLRWQHPHQGLVSPTVFIPIAEETGLITDIGHWVFNQTAHQVQRWRNHLHPEFQISVNQSAAQFREEGPLVGLWARQLTSLGQPGRSLVIEITESLLMEANDTTRRHLTQLRQAGLQIALDDFGTGYSAMSFLHDFELDYLKIDKAFVQHLPDNDKDLALCKATIVMAHELGLQVVAEGIETDAQREVLAHAGCDLGQGYLFSRPVTAHALEDLVKRQSSPHSTRMKRQSRETHSA